MSKKALPRAISIDCEMVGCGENGSISVLGRIAVVDDKLKLLMDAFVKPSMRVTNFRTRWSGLTWEKLKRGEPLESIQKKFIQIVEHYRKESSTGLVFVGHDVSNDFQVLQWTPSESEIRDTSTYFPLRKLLIESLLEKGEVPHARKEGILRQKPSLKTLRCQVHHDAVSQGQGEVGGSDAQPKEPFLPPGDLQGTLRGAGRGPRGDSCARGHQQEEEEEEQKQQGHS
ncbi:hypothetical protein OJ253_1440 [Cryptosporidium canis]|uniref:Exonuclease domain-containing protein n=1 Tax=Cryptosporidium canis TaxID=195482 RepID=A0A9D5HZ36_9CRYT|nr:hypothetical protein OJ253_1440 [Cryptosporidium canis]